MRLEAARGGNGDIAISLTKTEHMKQKNNEQMLKDLIKDLSPIEIALLRERIVTVCEQTAEASKNWHREESFVMPEMYQHLNEMVQKHLGFGEM